MLQMEGRRESNECKELYEKPNMDGTTSEESSTSGESSSQETEIDADGARV